MGAVHFSIDPKLVSILQQELPLSVFVETGTFEGESIQRTRPFFQKIYSSEWSEKYFRKASKRFEGEDSVCLFHGESAKFLKDLRPALKDTSVLYWLDAHWCAEDKTDGNHCQCPLLDELNEISGLNSLSVLLIDDARLFLSPPPLPHDISQWPRFDSIVRKLFTLSSTHDVMVLNDMILYFPQHIRDSVNKYALEYSVDWLSVFDKSRHYDSLLLQLKEKDLAIQEKQSQILLLTKMSRDKEAQIRVLSEDQKKVAAVAKERNAALQEKEAQIQLLSQAIKERDGALEEKEAQIRLLDEAVRERDAALKAKESQIQLLAGLGKKGKGVDLRALLEPEEKPGRKRPR